MKKQHNGCLSWGAGGCSESPLRVLSVHLVQEGRGVSGDGHGRALDHRAGRRPRRHPLGFLPPLCFFFLQPLLGHLAPVHCGGVAAAGPARRENRRGAVLVKGSDVSNGLQRCRLWV